MNSIDDHRIGKRHIDRAAIVYVRQSDPQQVREHTESTRLQRGLREKAIELGWLNPVILDKDLGVTANGFAERSGFQWMLTQVTMRQVGIILCIDASRLSRNSKDWAHLFEMCGYFDTLVADIQQVYDVTIPNDRLILQIKGTVAELELANMRARLQAGIESKASRGELKVLLPSGYTYDSDDQIVKDPDKRIQQAILFMFEKFEQCTSLRQLAMYYRDTHTLFPVRKRDKKHSIRWEEPKANMLQNLISHPIYAGVYSHGRKKTFVDCVNGKLVKRTRRISSPEEWKVCIMDHHQAYISWEQYKKNQARLAESKPRWTMDDNRGAIREGRALLSGLLRCGHCGRKLRVIYNRKSSAQYYCDGSAPRGTKRCLAFGAKYVDQKVGEQLCHALEPLAIKAAREAFALEQQKCERAIEQTRLRVQAAQYEADRAFEQYDLADPKNRLVVDTLESRLNQKLAELRIVREALEQSTRNNTSLTDDQKEQLQNLAGQFPVLWNHPDTPTLLRKKLLRTTIREIVVTHNRDNGIIELVLHWEGDVCTSLAVKKRKTPVGSKTDRSLIELVAKLSQTLADGEIARILNMKEIPTPRELRWTKDRVKNFRAHHSIRQASPKASENVYTGQQARNYLGIGYHGLVALIERGVLHTNQVTDFAPWRIPRSELNSTEVQDLVKVLKKTGKLPPKEGSPQSQTSFFPNKTSLLQEEAL